MGDERSDQRRDEGQDRVDPQHRGDQRQDGRDLAQEHGREPRQRFLDEGEIGREALRQRGRALAPELGQIGVDQMRIEGRLHVGLDAGHDAVGQDREAEEREALDRRDRHHEQRRQHDGALVLGREGVEGRLDEDRIEPGRAGDEDDEPGDGGELAAVRPHPLPPQSPDRGQGVSRDRRERSRHPDRAITRPTRSQSTPDTKTAGERAGRLRRKGVAGASKRGAGASPAARRPASRPDPRPRAPPLGCRAPARGSR